MGRSYKNFWSLNTDEAVVTGILRSEIGKKNIEVLMPLNAQMKGIDLVLLNIQNKKKPITIQVKGSRAFEPSENQAKEYKEGSPGWFRFSADVIDKASADYFIFLIYVIEQSEDEGRRYIKPHTITIPTKSLQSKARVKSTSGNVYNFIIWVKPKAGEAFDIRHDVKENHEHNGYDEYLNKNGFDKLKKSLGK